MVERKKIDYVKSPVTGKWIKVHGTTYQKLEASPVMRKKLQNSPRSKRYPPGVKTSHSGKVTKKVSLPKAKEQSLRETYNTTPRSRRYKRTVLSREIGSKQGRGMRTRGWAAAAPQKGKERHELMHKCGSQCFLMPDREGFPVCAALRTGEGCKVDCRGIIAAKVRAGEWKYKDVLEAASKLEKQYGCLRR